MLMFKHLSIQTIRPQTPAKKLEEKFKTLVQNSWQKDESDANVYYLYEKISTVEDLPPLLRQIENNERKTKTILKVHLDCNYIGSKGCAAISKAKFTNLVQLHLGFNSIRDRGCEYIAKGAWPNLKDIDLENNGITEKGCAYLCQASWSQLEEMQISQNPIHSIGVKMLVGSFPDCFISSEWEIEEIEEIEDDDEAIQ